MSDAQFFRKYANIIAEAETQQLDEGVADSLKQLYQSAVSKIKAIPDFKKYYDAAKPLAKQAFRASKGCKTPEELKQALLPIAQSMQLPATEGALNTTAGYAHAAAATAAATYLSVAVGYLGLYGSVAQYIAQGDTGGAFATAVFSVIGQLMALMLALTSISEARGNDKYNQRVGYTKGSSINFDKKMF